jgi:predicted nucleic acid-binding protein
LRFLYIDSSVLVSLALFDSSRTREAQKKIAKFDIFTTSEIAVVECQAGLSTQLGSQVDTLIDAEQNLNQILASLLVYKVDSLVLGHARSLVKQYRASIGLRSLDAIHVATANMISQSFDGAKGTHILEYLTADRKQHGAFTAEGYLGTLI